MAETLAGDAGFRYQFTSAIGLAWDSLVAHKLRTFLTLLGIMIGVASVILVGSAIDGLGLYAEESTAKAFGSESFVLHAGHQRAVAQASFSTSSNTTAN